MKLDYIYITIGILTLIINGFLVASYIKLNFGNGKRHTKTLPKNDSQKKSDDSKCTNPVAGTMGANDENMTN